MKDKIQDFVMKFAKKKNAPLILGGIILAIVLIVVLFVVLFSSPSAKSLLNKNFQNGNLATELDISISINSRTKKVDTIIHREKNKDTEHLVVGDWDCYITPADNKLAVYKLTNNGIYELSYIKKNISQDDIRTDYIEKNDEINLTDINLNTFSDVVMNKEGDNYIITGKTNYITVLAILDNARQVLDRKWLNYTYFSKFLLSNAAKIEMNVKMTFNKKTELLNQIEFSLDRDALSKTSREGLSKEDLRPIDMKIVIDYTNYKNIEMEIPKEVEKNAIISEK